MPRMRHPGATRSGLRAGLLRPLVVLAALHVALVVPAARAEDFSNGDRAVRITDIPSKTDPDEIEDQKLELVRGGKVIASFSVSGYIRDAYWSPDGKWVAVNVRHANSGDYMWVLDAASGKAVRQPSDDIEAPWESAAYAAFKKMEPKAIPDLMLHEWKFARGWTADGKLTAVVRADYAEGAGRFEYIIPMTVGPDGLTPGAAKLTHAPLE